MRAKLVGPSSAWLLVPAVLIPGCPAFLERISDKRTKNEAKTDKTEHGMEEHGKKTKSKSTVKVNPGK
ncbi:hypothetical protein Tco_0041560, partial [Tanacetum coccineum]